MTMALRVPTLANTCGPVATGSHTAAISSSRPSTLRLGPTKYSLIGMLRLRCNEATSTSAPAAMRGGWQSPAGEAEPRLPPIVPRLRIGGEPTVRAARANPGRSSPKWAIISL